MKLESSHTLMQLICGQRDLLKAIREKKGVFLTSVVAQDTFVSSIYSFPSKKQDKTKQDKTNKKP